MNEYTVSPIENINYNATGIEAILQNVAFIMSTHVGSCPLDRSFGYVPPVDEPMQVALALNETRLVDAIALCEPRVTVLEVNTAQDYEKGHSVTRVKVTINESI